MVKTDNTAYQALVLVWLGCGNKLLNQSRLKISGLQDKQTSVTEQQMNQRKMSAMKVLLLILFSVAASGAKMQLVVLLL